MQSKPDAFIVTVIKAPARETTAADVIVGALGAAGALVVIALVLGAVIGGILVAWHRFRPRDWRPMPPVTPSLPGDVPPSSRSL